MAGIERVTSQPQTYALDRVPMGSPNHPFISHIYQCKLIED